MHIPTAPPFLYLLDKLSLISSNLRFHGTIWVETDEYVFWKPPTK
jgi:hypothetical protein